MRRSDMTEFLLLGAIWGGSFPLMKTASPEFGPVPLIAVRVLIAAAFLGAILASRGALREVAAYPKKLLFLGALNSAIPFSLFAFATLSLPAGYSSVLNATAPLFAGLIAMVFLGERWPIARVAGLLLGFGGVVLLVWEKLGVAGDRVAIGAGLLAALCYGISTHYTRRKLAGVNPIVIAGGSQIAAAALLLPLAGAMPPAAVPSSGAWASAVALGIVCTGLAYVLYFRLIKNIGPSRAITVTYLIPAFGVLWSAIFRGEPLHPAMLAGGATILLGTWLAARVAPSVTAAPARPTP